MAKGMAKGSRGGMKLRKPSGAAAAKSCSSSGRAPEWMVYTAFALVGLLVLALVYQFLLRPLMGGGGAPAWREGYVEASKQGGELAYLFMTGCGWCERFSPTWDEFTSRFKGELNGAGVKARKIESSEAAAAAYKKNVQGYPTVLFTRPDGSVSKFEGERTTEGLVAFLKQNGVDLRGKGGGGGLEGFFEARRHESGAGKQLKASAQVVKSNTGDKEQTESLSKSSGMDIPKKDPPKKKK